jgi:hypothetical protein
MKGKIMEPQFEEGKEKEPHNIAVMEKFKYNGINSMSIIVVSIKDHLNPTSLIFTHLRRCTMPKLTSSQSETLDK